MQYLVQGDNGPQIKATITREGAAFNLTGYTVKMHFRRKGDDDLLFTLDTQSSEADLELGVAIFAFGDNDLNVSEGQYEGEIEMVSSSGVKETIYEIIDFFVREDFA